MATKILIADDEKHILDTVGAYLKNDSIEVITASNGQDALAAFRHEKPDLVILDVMMPEMDGLAAARLIRKSSNVPIMFLTARVDEIDQIGLSNAAPDGLEAVAHFVVLPAEAKANGAKFRIRGHCRFFLQ